MCRPRQQLKAPLQLLLWVSWSSISFLGVGGGLVTLMISISQLDLKLYSTKEADTVVSMETIIEQQDLLFQRHSQELLLAGIYLPAKLIPGNLCDLLLHVQSFI